MDKSHDKTYDQPNTTQSPMTEMMPGKTDQKRGTLIMQEDDPRLLSEMDPTIPVTKVVLQSNTNKSQSQLLRNEPSQKDVLPTPTSGNNNNEISGLQPPDAIGVCNTILTRGGSFETLRNTTKLTKKNISQVHRGEASSILNQVANLDVENVDVDVFMQNMATKSHGD